ncbi:MAG: hypothetical protein FJ267_12000, partial [Planctomycetes bacterium]|nr:hypothetical protein [Planctomycetota bacterium]
MDDDDEFAALNSISSEGESLGGLPSMPARRRKKSSSSEENVEEKPTRRKKKKSASVGFGGPFSAIFGATVAGILGASAWGGIAYASGYEIGYLAWAIGGLVGVGVRMSSTNVDEGIAGIIAAIWAALSIIAGKLLTIYLFLGSELGGGGELG